MVMLVAVVDKLDVRSGRGIAVRLDHTLSGSVEFGDKMHGGGVLGSRSPQRFTVVCVGFIGMIVHGSLLTVVNDGDAAGG